MKNRVACAEPAQCQAAAAPERQALVGVGDSGLAVQRSSLQFAINQSPRVLAQRRAINAAFGNAVQRQADRVDALSGAGVIQGKFGFEIELGVALSGATGTNVNLAWDRYVSPEPHMKSQPKVAEGDGFRVHVDHKSAYGGLVNDSGAAPIVELVTDPMDEWVDDEPSVIAKMTKVVECAESLRDSTAGFAGRALLSNIRHVTTLNAKSGSNFFVGSDAPEKGKQNIDKAYLHATQGAKLESIPTLFKFMTRQEESGSDVQFLSDAVQKSNEIVLSLGTWAMKTLAVPVSQQMVRKLELKPLRGYVAMVLNYLYAFRNFDFSKGQGLWKNQSGQFFYKTDLGVLRNALVGLPKDILDRPDGRERVKALLLEKTGLTASDHTSTNLDASSAIDLATSKAFLVGWVNRILNGQSDILLEAMINQWSTPLGPEPLGEAGHQHTGAVMENRWVHQGVGSRYTKNKTPAQWIEIATYTRNYLRDVNATDPRDPTVTSKKSG